MHPVFIVLLGKPGSGKNFLGDLLIGNQLIAEKIIPGKIYRAWVKQRLDRWEYINDCLKRRDLVDDETTIHCVEQRVEDALKGVNLIFFDGFPRNDIQLSAFMSIAKERNAEVHFVYIDRTDDFCKKKAKERAAKDVAAGNEPRSDSHDEAIRRGLDQFYTHTLPIIEEIQERDYIIHHLKTDDDLAAVIPSKMNFWALFQLCRFKKTVVHPVGEESSTCCDAPCHE
jgi:adenylate kinase family enzyme